MLVEDELRCTTRGRGFTEITGEVAAAVARAGLVSGLCALYIRHTSASLLISENADGEVLRDLERFMQRLVPDGDPLFRHRSEGPDDMPAHIRSVLTASELSVPVRQGRLALGTWQGIYLWEHRHCGQERQVLLTLLGAP